MHATDVHYRIDRISLLLSSRTLNQESRRSLVEPQLVFNHTQTPLQFQWLGLGFVINRSSIFSAPSHSFSLPVLSLSRLTFFSSFPRFSSAAAETAVAHRFLIGYNCVGSLRSLRPLTWQSLEVSSAVERPSSRLNLWNHYTITCT